MFWDISIVKSLERIDFEQQINKLNLKNNLSNQPHLISQVYSVCL